MYFTWDMERAGNGVRSMVLEGAVEEWGVKLRLGGRVRGRERERRKGLEMEGGRDVDETGGRDGEDEDGLELEDELGLDGVGVSDEARMERNEEVMDDSLMRTFPHMHWALPGQFFSFLFFSSFRV